MPPPAPLPAGLPERTEIRRPRVKWLLSALGCLVFVAGAAWSIPATEPGIDRNALLFVVAFFGVGAVVLLLYSVFLRGPALVFDREGFVDRTTFVTPGRVWWWEVSDLQLVRARNSSWIRVHAHDPESVVSRVPAGWRRRSAARQLRQTGAAFSIGTTAMPSNRMLALMRNYWAGART